MSAARVHRLLVRDAAAHLDHERSLPAHHHGPIGPPDLFGTSVSSSPRRRRPWYWYVTSVGGVRFAAAISPDRTRYESLADAKAAAAAWVERATAEAESEVQS